MDFCGMTLNMKKPLFLSLFVPIFLVSCGSSQTRTKYNQSATTFAPLKRTTTPYGVPNSNSSLYTEPVPRASAARGAVITPAANSGSPPRINTQSNSASDFSIYQDFDKIYASMSGSKSKGEKHWIKYSLAANQIGVVTLKTQTRGADFDVFVSNSSYGNRSSLGKSTQNGLTTDLVLIPPKGHARNLYIEVENTGNYGSFKLFCHEVSPAEKMGIALTETMVAEFLGGSAFDTRMVSFISSGLQGNNARQMTRDAFITELRIAARKEVGHGPEADVLVGFVIGVLIDCFKYY